MGILVAIGVYDWHQIEVILIENVGMVVCIVEELGHNVCNGCGADPLPGMYAAINPDSWLPESSGGRGPYLDEEKLPPLIGIPDPHILSLV